MGNLGAGQLEWLEKDVKALSASTPVVVFAHIPLWTVYPEWGWGTEDGTRALSSETVRVGDRAERAHSSDYAEDRGQRRVPHRPFDCVSATGSGHGTIRRSHEVPAGELRRLSSALRA